jgi:hypothetical protein
MPLDNNTNSGARSRPWNWQYPSEWDRQRVDYYGLASGKASTWDGLNRVPLLRNPPTESSGRDNLFPRPNITQAHSTPRGLGASFVPIAPHQKRQMGANVEGVQLFDRPTSRYGSAGFRSGVNYAPIATGTSFVSHTNPSLRLT